MVGFVGSGGAPAVRPTTGILAARGSLARPEAAAAPHSGRDVAGRVSEQRLGALLARWWHDERPSWTEPSWWTLTLRDDVRRLLWLPPGPALVTALAELDSPAPCSEDHGGERLASGWPVPGREAGWPCACQVVTAAAWDACTSWAAARTSVALVAAAGATPVTFTTPHSRRQLQDPARDELAHALRSSIPAMGNRIAAARALAECPRLVSLVTSGAISAWAARLVTDHLTDLEPSDSSRVVADVADRVLQRLAGGLRPYHSAEVNRLARAARLRLVPEQAQASRVRALADRRVCIHPRGDGMASLVADLAEVDAHRIHWRLTAIAAGLQADGADDGPPEPRTRDQVRADVLVDLLLGGPTVQPGAPGRAGDTSSLPAQEDGPHGGSAPPRPDIQVVVSLETLLGLAEQPAHVPGLGPIPAEVARELAAEGRWRALVSDASGAITAVGSHTYTPGAAVARLVRAREPHCRFPGCRQPAVRCDLDHTVPWPRGATTPQNLGPLCRRHHRLKTDGGWALEPLTGTEPGPEAPRWRWTSPAGLTACELPDPLLP